MVAPANAAGGELNPDGTITGCLSAPAQGDGLPNRDGNKIMIKSILVQGVITIPVGQDQADQKTTPCIYLAIVQDKQTSGATLNSEDVFTNPAGVAVMAANPSRNINFSKRFKVLATWQYCFPPNINTVNDQATFTINTAGAHVNFTIGKKFKKFLPVQFNTGTTANVTSVVDNSLHLVGFCSSTSYTPSISYNSRLRFIG